VAWASCRSSSWKKQQGLIERKAREAGIAQLKAAWIKLGGPALVNDRLVSGPADVVAAGPPVFLTLWDRTRGNAEVRAWRP
jgi:NitT/TauT family transport system substrate-binding protein